MRFIKLIILVGFVMLSACSGKNGKKQASKAEFGNKNERILKYAKGFRMKSTTNYQYIEVDDPWAQTILAKYVLVPKGIEIPNDLPVHDFLVRTPVEKVAILSSTHIGPLAKLNKEASIVGATDPEKIYNKNVYKNYEKGQIIGLGDGMTWNFENLLDLSPDVLFKSGFTNVRTEMKRVEEANLPVAYNCEWMETSLLGRAEWIKFMAAFYNASDYADSIFSEMEQNYLALKKKVKQVEQRPSVLSGTLFKGTWYMPGGQSYNGILFKDANANYFYEKDSTTGSLPLSFEVVMENQLEANKWIGVRANSLKDLKEQDERYELFSAFKSGEVYSSQKRRTKQGGNDYWESGVSNPDIILKDVIKVLHPDLFPEYELFYFEKLN